MNPSTPLPSMLNVPIWTFEECVRRLKRSDRMDDLDPEAERQLCLMAEEECGVSAVFVLGFPLSAWPFYTHPLTETTAAGFDLLFNGLEITTGGQRLHRRDDLECVLVLLDEVNRAGDLRHFLAGLDKEGELLRLSGPGGSLRGDERARRAALKDRPVCLVGRASRVNNLRCCLNSRGMTDAAEWPQPNMANEGREAIAGR